MKITLGELKTVLKESLGAKADEEFLEKNGWWPIDAKLMQWAHSERTDSEPVSRLTALKLAGRFANKRSPDLTVANHGIEST